MTGATTCFTSFSSPVGELTLIGTAQGLEGVWFDTARHARDRSGWQRDDALFAEARTQLEEYFRGERQCFTLKLAARGTVFQRQCWAALSEIPYGETRSYGQQARAIAKEKAVRAVGLANGQNPISIIVPCHRVIGVNGALTGFGGGIERKRWLLEHEARHVAASLPTASTVLPTTLPLFGAAGAQ